MIEVSDAGWRDDVLHSEIPVVVLFWAPWNGGCKQYRPLFESVAERFTDRVQFAKVNMDEQSEVATSLNVRTLPTTALVNQGELVLLAPGVKSANDLVELISTHFARQPTAGTETTESSEDTEPSSVETESPITGTEEIVMQEVTDQTWEEEVLKSDLPVIVDFWASWCPPCRQFTPIFTEFAEQQAGKIKCLKLNSDENTKTAGGYSIRSIPAILFFKGGQEVGRDLGLKTIPQLELLAERHFGSTEAATEAPPQS